MQSMPYRVLLALAALSLCWMAATLPTGVAWAGGDGDDDAADDDDDTSGDDDSDGDDDDSSVGSTSSDSEVPYENRELGGGCACSIEGSAGSTGFLVPLLAAALLLRRRRSASAV